MARCLDEAKCGGGSNRSVEDLNSKLAEAIEASVAAMVSQHRSGDTDPLQTFATKSPKQYIRLLVRVLKLELKSPVAAQQIAQSIFSIRSKPPRRAGSAQSTSVASPMPQTASAEAALLAAARCGFNGRGKGGLIGYLQRLCQSYPQNFVVFWYVIQKAEIRAERLALKKADGIADVDSADNAPSANKLYSNTIFDSASAVSLGRLVVMASAKVGSNGNGQLGATGYLYMLGVRYRPIAIRFLCNFLQKE